MQNSATTPSLSVVSSIVSSVVSSVDTSVDTSTDSLSPVSTTPFDAYAQSTSPAANHPGHAPEWLSDLIAARDSVRHFLLHHWRYNRVRRLVRRQQIRWIRSVRSGRDKDSSLTNFICEKFDAFTGADVLIDELFDERAQMAQHIAQLQQSVTEQEELAETEKLNRQDLERVVLQFEAETQHSLDARDRVIAAQQKQIDDLMQEKLQFMAQISHLHNIVIGMGADFCTENADGKMNHGSQEAPSYNQPLQTIKPLPRPASFQDYSQGGGASGNDCQRPTSRLVVIHTVCPPLEEK